MARKQTAQSNGKKVTARKPGRGRTAARTRQEVMGGNGASRLPETAGPISAAPFAEVFTSYWDAIRAGQAAVLSTTQAAYAEMLKSFQAAWENETGKERFAEACRLFTTALRALQDGEDTEALAELYRKYVDDLRDAWLQPELTEALEEGYLTYSETVQKAADEAQQQAEEARRQYLLAIRDACSKVDIESLSPEDLAVLSRNMMVTVFFTDGVRTDNA